MCQQDKKKNDGKRKVVFFSHANGIAYIHSATSPHTPKKKGLASSGGAFLAARNPTARKDTQQNRTSQQQTSRRQQAGLFLGSALLEVGEEGGECRGLLSVVRDDSARALDDLGGDALRAQAAEAGPLSESLARLDLDELGAVVVAEGLDELGVLGLVAVLGEAAQERVSLVEGLAGLVEAAAEAVVEERRLQDLAEGVLDGHLRGNTFIGHF